MKIFQVKSETLEIKNNLVKDTGHSTNPSLDIKTPDGLGPTSLVANTNEPPRITVKHHDIKKEVVKVKVDKTVNNVEKYSSPAVQNLKPSVVPPSAKSGLTGPRSDLNLDKSEQKKPSGKFKTENKSDKYR